MNLGDIEVLLHIYTTPAPHQGEIDNPDWWRGCVARLKAMDLIENASDLNRAYQTTDRADVYCEAIRNVPLPTLAWVI